MVVMFTRRPLYCLFAIMLAVALGSCGEVKRSLGESGSVGSSHNAGADCIYCHVAKYAGTVYQSASGGYTSNSVVVITETSGAVLEIVSDASGNFYTQRGNPSDGYTATVKGNTIGMATKPTGGACSSKGCHDGAATPRIYIN
jgi:hypothetical protein